jgi:hypothetical protein
VIRFTTHFLRIEFLHSLDRQRTLHTARIIDNSY